MASGKESVEVAASIADSKDMHRPVADEKLDRRAPPNGENPHPVIVGIELAANHGKPAEAFAGALDLKKKALGRDRTVNRDMVEKLVQILDRLGPIEQLKRRGRHASCAVQGETRRRHD